MESSERPPSHAPAPAPGHPASNGLPSAPELPGREPQAAPDLDTDQAGQPDAAGQPTPAPEHPLKYWSRPLVLSLLVGVLLLLTWWDMRRVPNHPPPPTVLQATPPAGGGVTASDPALADTLARLRAALDRRDARAMANLADPEGLVVAAYGGALPDSGYSVTDAARFAQELLAGSKVEILGWRNDGGGRVIVLTDGWRRRPLRLSGNSTLEMTSFAAIGLVPRGSTWYWRWLLPDAVGVLAQQARTTGWQSLPR